MMFCGNCGGKLSENAGFCGECGKPMAKPKHEPLASRAVSASILPHRKWKTNRLYIVIAVAVVAIIAFTQLGNSGGQSGLHGSWVMEWRSGHMDRENPPTIEFSGNRFTVTRHGSAGGLVPSQGVPRENCTQRTYTDVGNNRRRTTITGTFSISGDSVELICGCGRIEARSFSYTENTLNLWGARFVRR